jgi:hypothetical protein
LSIKVLTLALILALWSLPSRSQEIGVGGISPDFTLLNHRTGEPVSLYDYAGHVIVLDFFAVW